MNAKQLIMASVIMVPFQLCSAQPAPQQFERIETTNGRVYSHAVVRKRDSLSISIIHDSGVSKIPFESLSPDIQKMFGYDPKKAVEEKRRLWEALPAAARYSVSPGTGIGCKIRFEDHLLLLAKAKAEAAAELLNPAQTRAKLASVPRGGYIWFEIERSTIGAANTDSFVAIVSDVNGKELVRKVGENDIAQVPIGNRMWWNNFLIVLQKEIPDVLKVRLVDRVDRKTADFVIKKNSLP